MPERASLQVHFTVTSLLYHPALLAASACPLKSGAVLSTLMPDTVVPALFPATSVAVPDALWLAPSPRMVGTEQPATPERVSAQANVIVTSLLYHCRAFGVPFVAPLMVGLVLSRFTVAVSLAVLPALSRAIPVTF